MLMKCALENDNVLNNIELYDTDGSKTLIAMNGFFSSHRTRKLKKSVQ